MPHRPWVGLKPPYFRLTAERAIQWAILFNRVFEKNLPSEFIASSQVSRPIGLVV